jgi:hypothetical protein
MPPTNKANQQRLQQQTCQSSNRRYCKLYVKINYQTLIILGSSNHTEKTCKRQKINYFNEWINYVLKNLTLSQYSANMDFFSAQNNDKTNQRDFE